MTPQLRFPEFTDEWQVKKLGDIGKVITGNTPSTSDRSLYGRDYDFVSPGDMNTGRYVTSTKQKLSEKGFSKSRQLQPGSVLFVCIGSTIGKVAQVKSWSTTNQQINAVITDNSNENDFIYLLLTKISPKIKLLAGEQAVPIISKGSFQIIEVALPSKPEQKKIAEFLTAVDERIGAGEKKLELLQTYKRGAMQKIFSGSVRFKDANGNDYPDWEEEKFDDVFDGIASKKYQVQSNEYHQNGKYPVIDQGQSAIVGYSNEAGKLFTDTPVIVFGDHTTILKLVTFDFIVGADGTKLLKPKGDNKINYLYQFLLHNKLVPEGYKRHFSNLRQLRILTPKAEEQQKIADFLTALDDKIKAEETKLAAAHKFKKALLQRMFL